MKKDIIKKYQKVIVSVFVILCAAVSGVAVYAGSPGSPGSDTDPLVTKSYVDSAIRDALSDSGNKGGSAVSAKYEVVSLDAGESLIGSEGTEIILRSGQATAIDNGSNGVSDMTDGADLRTGDKVIANHLLLVPRKDGRGIKVSTEAYLMVRGAYTID